MSQVDDIQLDLTDPAATPPDGGAAPDGGASPVTPAGAPVESAEPAWARAMVDALQRVGTQREPAAPTGQPPMSAEQIRALNEELSGQVLTNPLGVISSIADRMASEKIAQFQRDAEPYMDGAVDGFIDRFKGRKRDDDPLYKQTVTEFERDLESLNLRTMVGKNVKERNAELDLRWQAAQGRVLAKKVRPSTLARPPGTSAGDGTTLGGGPSPDKVVELSEAEKRQLYRNFPKEEADRLIASIEAGEEE
jgi:hypothetical protein